MEEIIIEKIEWSAPEYNHKERSPDWLWSIGLVTLVTLVVAIWFKNYLFALFLLISGACLILFTIRHPRIISFSVDTNGLTIGKDKYPWKDLKGFNIKKDDTSPKLLIETKKYFLPVYTLPIPTDKVQELRTSFLKVLPNNETLDESASMQFMEKLGF